MKKYFIPAVALAALAFTSCSSDEQPGSVQEGPAVFTVRIPGGIGSRATLGDQTVADVDNLQWSVYEVDGTTKTFVYSDQKENAFPGDALEESVTIQLAKGKKYQVVFYADNAENTFASFADGMVSVAYANGASNTVAEDAFTGISAEFDGNAGIRQTVTLTRPFAQLNWGTDDLDAKSIAAYVASLTAKVTVSGSIYSKFNALTGEVTGEVTAPVNFDPITVNDIEEGITFPVAGYDLLAMNYLLTGNGTIECTLTFNNGFDPVTVNSVPVQVNHRTNIYGSLLTLPTDFKIIVDPAFQTPDNNVGLAPWDGTTVTAPAIDETAKTVTVGSGAELAGLAAMVNDATNPNSLEGYTVNLTGDIDMGNHEMPTIGSATRISSAATGKIFKGVIDGKGNTIKNFSITNNGAASSATALVPALGGANAAVRNLKLANVTVTASQSEQTAAVVGLLTGGATVENVEVVSGTVSGTNATAGVVARVMKEGSVKNCINNATVKGSGYNCGGIVGAAYYNPGNAGMTIQGCTNNGNVSGTSAVGGVVGLSVANLSDCANNGAITGTGTSVGGVVGEQQNTGNITDCSNTGKVTNTSTNYGAGGIVGWVRYSGAANTYTTKTPVVISGCSNSAEIAGLANGVGGIAGVIYNYGTVTGCTNTAPALTGTQFVAGLVGNQQVDAGSTIAGVDAMVNVTDNVSTTPLSAMTGALTSQWMYVNNAAAANVSGNRSTL